MPKLVKDMTQAQYEQMLKDIISQTFNYIWTKSDFDGKLWYKNASLELLEWHDFTELSELKIYPENIKLEGNKEINIAIFNDLFELKNSFERKNAGKITKEEIITFIIFITG